MMMKTNSPPAVMTPGMLMLALLAATLVYMGGTGKNIPLLSNVRMDILLLVLIGITICSKSGIGRIAATGQWLHPFAIIGYILGGLILLVAVSVFLGWKVPYIHNDTQALLAIAILMCIKVVNAIVHSLFT